MSDDSEVSFHDLPSQWKWTELADLASLINGDRGKNYPAQSDRVAYGVPFINTGHIEPTGRLSTERMDFITRANFEKLGSGKVKPGDILYCLRGSTIGKIARNEFEEGAIASSLVIIRAKKRALQQFIYFYLASPIGLALAKKFDNGSAQPNLSAETVSRYPIPLPPEEDVSLISQFLGALDDKIDLNRRMNETLEAMARALFKDWFVDFGPTRAKMALRGEAPMNQGTGGEAPQKENVAREPYLAPDLWDLFPDRLDADGKPEGWGVGTVGTCFKLTMGQSPPGNTYNEIGDGLPFFQGRTDFGFRYPENRKYCSAPKRIAEADDTLVSVRAPVGDINMSWEKCCIGRGVAALRHKSGSPSFTYYAAWSVQNELTAYEHTGTVFGAINKKQFEALSVVDPAPSVIEAFDEYVGPLEERIRDNITESRTLAQTRDLLLPKLMSGEIRLKDAEKQVEAVA